jgi:hypothetical protein
MKGVRMAKKRQILQMYFDGFSQRDICTALKCGHIRASDLIKIARRVGISREALSVMVPFFLVCHILPLGWYAAGESFRHQRTHPVSAETVTGY